MGYQPVVVEKTFPCAGDPAMQMHVPCFSNRDLLQNVMHNTLAFLDAPLKVTVQSDLVVNKKNDSRCLTHAFVQKTRGWMTSIGKQSRVQLLSKVAKGRKMRDDVVNKWLA